MILTAAGQPAPPTDVVKRLGDIDPKLSLLMVNMPSGDNTLQWWAVVREWDDGDPRWQQVYNGEIGKQHARDMVCQLPLDCSADQAVAYLIQGYHSYAGTRADYLKALRRVDEWNARNLKAIKAEAEEFTREEVSKVASELQGKTTVYMNDKRRKRAR